MTFNDFHHRVRRMGLRHLYDELPRRRNRLQSLLSRVGAGERHAIALECRVAVYHDLGNRSDAYREALELDEVRRELNDDRATARRLQVEYRQHVEWIARMEARAV